MFSSRRQFIKSLGLAAGAAVTGNVCSAQPVPDIPEGNEIWDAGVRPSSRPAGSMYMGGFRAPGISRICMAFIGVGGRGRTHVEHMCVLDGTEVVAICDLDPDLVRRSQDMVLNKMGKIPAGYSGGPKEYLKMLKQQRPDIVIISTDWGSHASIACDCMRHGAHVFVEVPLAVSMKELWDVVDTAEATKRHCMMLENVNYGREELMFLNMCRQGVIGELLHGEAAYLHCLINQQHSFNYGEGSWRPHYYTKINGNLYPTHGLGPVAQYMGLARGMDQFDRLVSFSSPALGQAAYAKRHMPPDHFWNKANFVCGDMNTAIVKTKLGRTIVVQLDETSPRPYSRLNLIQGTSGTLAGFPTRVCGEKLGDGNYHRWIQGDELATIYEKYEHPLWKRVGDLARKMGGHGGMDFLMLYRVMECLRNGWPMDQNVYEGAFWSSLLPLTAHSVAMGGVPVEFPDFTRGDWKKTTPLAVVK